MNLAIGIAIVIVGIVMILATARIIHGPTPADRVIGADLLTFGVIAQFALIGTRFARAGTYDLVLVATVVAFLAAVSFARVLGRGRR